MSSDKNELLFSRFNINYNNLPEIYRKGTTLIWTSITDDCNHDNIHHSKSSHGDGNSKTTDSGSTGTDSVVADVHAHDESFQTEIGTLVTGEHSCDGRISSGLDGELLSNGKRTEISSHTTQPDCGSESSSDMTSVGQRTTGREMEDDREGERRQGGPSGSRKVQRTILELHVDIIGDSFWKKYPHIIGRTD